MLKEILNGRYFKKNHPHNIFYQKQQYSDQYEIKISNVVFEEPIVIDQDLDCDFSVRIEECIFKREVTFQKGVFKNHIALSKNYFQRTVSFGFKIKCQSISIYNSTFTQNIYFGSGIFESVRLGNNKIKEVIVTGGLFKSLSIDGPNVEEISVYNPNTFVGTLGIGNNLCNTKVSLGNIIVNKLYIAGKFDSSNTIFIDNISLFSLKFSLLRNSGHIYFNNISVRKNEKEITNTTIKDFFDQLSINEIGRILDYQQETLDTNLPLHYLSFPINDDLWDKKWALQLNDSLTKNENQLEFDKVHIGFLEFKNIQLKNFNTIIVRDTDLSQLKTFNSTFPVKKIKGNYHSLYEIYNDLYSTAKAKNNRREQIGYYNASKDALLKSILNSKWYTKIPSIISLSMTKLYSNYGSRWPQSLFLITPIVALIFFSCMMLSTNFDLDLSPNGFQNFQDLIVYFLQFLNPAHSLNFMDNKIDNIIFSNSAYFVLFDLIGRVFIGIGIFETILAFRKYVRQ